MSQSGMMLWETKDLPPKLVECLLFSLSLFNSQARWSGGTLQPLDKPSVWTPTNPLEFIHSTVKVGPDGQVGFKGPDKGSHRKAWIKVISRRIGRYDPATYTPTHIPNWPFHCDESTANYVVLKAARPTAHSKNEDLNKGIFQWVQPFLLLTIMVKTGRGC